MIDYIITRDDMYVGAKLICIRSSTGWYTANEIYTVTRNDRESTKWPYEITSDNGYDIYNLAEIQLDMLQLYPYDKLSDQELFLFHLSGRLPWT